MPRTPPRFKVIRPTRRRLKIQCDPLPGRRLRRVLIQCREYCGHRGPAVTSGFVFAAFCRLLTACCIMGTIAQRELYRLIADSNGRGQRVVIATVAHTRGSTPQRRGAKMLFFEDGKTAGTVGGGCVEAEVWAEARAAMRSGISGLHHFALTADEASEEGMVCGGTMDIFIDVWGSQDR